MITDYLREALKAARYEKLEDGTFYGEVPKLQGVLSNADTLEACRDQLAEVIEEWILVRVASGLDVPALGNCRIQVNQVA